MPKWTPTETTELEWKWDNVTRTPKLTRGKNAIWIVVD